MGRSISKRQREWLICFGAIVLCTLFYSVYHLRVYLSSDSTSSLLMADSMAQGNVLLKGWVQGTNNFVFSEIVFYAIGRLLGIPYAAMLHVLPGVSGAVALAIGKKMQLLSEDIQVFCVTHLAQVAASGDHHLLVSKQDDGSLTTTSIHSLSEEERIRELAAIASSSQSEASLQAARELYAAARR